MPRSPPLLPMAAAACPQQSQLPALGQSQVPALEPSPPWGLLIGGPPCVGKSSALHAVLRDAGFPVAQVVVNGSHVVYLVTNTSAEAVARLAATPPVISSSVTSPGTKN